MLCATAALSQLPKKETRTLPGTSTKFAMVLLHGGVFTMGSAQGNADEKPPHKVLLSPFWIGEKEVTFTEWDTFFKAMDVPQTKAIKVDAVSRPTPQYIDLTWGMGRGRQPSRQ
ncbi:MAG: formylglycine-generating enzyme family protein [Bacteroidia bacterium]|nr:formylglycine-generating enzyme family protein [Bacteroidia bacterium]